MIRDASPQRRRRATLLDVRRINRASVLRVLHARQETSRQELGRLTGLSAGTITNVVNDLLAAGLAMESGTEGSDGGRPRVRVRMATDWATVVGVEVGETRVRVEAFDLALEPRGSRVHTISDGLRSPEDVVACIADAVERIFRDEGLDRSRLAGVGVGISGFVDDRLGLVQSPSIGWRDVPFATLLEQALHVPIHLDNGAKTLGHAEMWLGAGQGTANATVALLGTGVGAAVFADGELQRGAHSSAGEWGHVPVAVGGRPCRCGSVGCLEAYVGGWAIAARWAEATGQPLDDQEAEVGAFIAAIGMDPAADALADEVTEYLGAGLAVLVNLFNPERIVLSGWVGTALSQSLLERARVHAARYALEQPFGQAEFVLGQLGPDAVAVGAATLVIDSILAGDAPLPAAFQPTGTLT